MTLRKIDTLDGLRGIAVLLVLWAHFPQVGDSEVSLLVKKAGYFFYSGYLGVDIFFALSGFLITRILISDKESSRPILRRFYTKRILRIFPIYYLSILVVGYFITWKEMGWVATYLSNYFFVFYEVAHPMRHTWSLCIEEHYYLMWPLIISSFSLPTSRRIISILFPLIGVGSAILFLSLTESPISDNLIYRATNCRILTLAAGSTLAFYENRIVAMRPRMAFIASFAVVIIFLFMRTYYRIPVLDQLPGSMVEFLMSSAIATLTVLIFININERQDWIRTIGANAPLKFMGKISYGVYLYHYPLFYSLGITDDQTTGSISLAFGIVAIAACVGIATVSYYFIEAPLLRLKDKL